MSTIMDGPLIDTELFEYSHILFQAFVGGKWTQEIIIVVSSCVPRRQKLCLHAQADKVKNRPSNLQSLSTEVVISVI